MITDAFDVLAKFLDSVVGVGDANGDHSTDDLDAFPQLQSLMTHELFTLRAHHLGAMALALSPAQVFTGETQPCALTRNAV